MVLKCLFDSLENVNFQGNLMKLYGDTVQPPWKRYFNYRLSRIRDSNQGAFRGLKRRSRVLHRKYESKECDSARAMGLVCVILVNICIVKLYEEIS